MTCTSGSSSHSSSSGGKTQLCLGWMDLDIHDVESRVIFKRQFSDSCNIHLVQGRNPSPGLSNRAWLFQLSRREFSQIFPSTFLRRTFYSKRKTALTWKLFLSDLLLDELSIIANGVSYSRAIWDPACKFLRPLSWCWRLGRIPFHHLSQLLSQVFLEGNNQAWL